MQPAPQSFISSSAQLPSWRGRRPRGRLASALPARRETVRRMVDFMVGDVVWSRRVEVGTQGNSSESSI